jgi:acetyl-CoA/propionyl-CoA carboxylase carboxyl transferase subunit
VHEDLRPQVELDLAAEHEIVAGGLDRAMEIGVVDEVVQPSATRRALAAAIIEAPQLRGRHGNIPL